jgi:hypothetical protein
MLDQIPWSRLNRSQWLMVGLVATVVVWQGGSWASAWLLDPLRSRWSDRDRLESKVSDLEDQAVLLAKATKELSEFQRRSLPPDRKQPNAKTVTALNAQRLYQEWITDLVHLCGWDRINVSPSNSRSSFSTGSQQIAVAVPVDVEAEARYDQLCQFLDHFYRTALLHRVTSLKISSRESTGDPVLKINMTVEGLALLSVPERRTLFPVTRLSQAVEPDDTELVVTSADGFPKKAPFRVRLGNEFLTVTGLQESTWTVERGVDRTAALPQTVNEAVELTPLVPDRPNLSTDEFRALLAANPFIKPPPPIEYRLKWEDPGVQPLVRGNSLRFELPVKGYDPTLGRPTFLIAGPAAPGVLVDRQSGVLTWTPPSQHPAGRYPVPLTIEHPSSPDGPLKVTVTIELREVNTPPTVMIEDIPPVYLGRSWRYALKIVDAESPPEKCTVKLADGSPAGLTWDAAQRVLLWTPPEATTPGNVAVSVTVTDDGLPPQTVTTPLNVKVEEDAAGLTFLVGIIAKNEQREAWLYDRGADRKSVLMQGDAVQVADVKGTVQEIGKDYLVLAQADQQFRLKLGDHLRQLQPMGAAASSPSGAPAGSAPAAAPSASPSAAPTATPGATPATKPSAPSGPASAVP